MPRPSGRLAATGRTRAVLDTNVLVSGLISPAGPPALLVMAWRNKQFDLVVSPPILEEVATVLQKERIRRYYEHLGKDVPARYVAALRRFAVLVPGETRVEGACADPDDGKFLAAAIEGGAHYVVSGDRHLLDLRQYRGVEIIRPVEFLARLGTGRRPKHTSPH